MVDVVKRKPGRPAKPRPVETVEAHVDPINEVESGADGDADDGDAESVAVVFGDAVGPDSGGVVEADPLSPREIEEAKNVPALPDIGASLQRPEPVPVLTPKQVVALDLDFDGEAGGSRPVASLSELQRDAFAHDAIDAYEGQIEVKRVDGFNRVWTFRHEIVKSQDHMLVECRRGPTVAQRLISSALFTKGQAMVAIEGADAETAR
jgi:hypothetical protein